MRKCDTTYTESMDMLVLTAVGILFSDVYGTRQIRDALELMRKLVQGCLELAVIEEDEEEDIEKMRRRIEQIYRDVIATTPLSDTFDTGRLKDAYVHGIHMVAEHTADLMAQRMLELFQDVQEDE